MSTDPFRSLSSPMSRRRFLHTLGAAGLVAGGGAALSACGGGLDVAGAGAAPAGPPRRGGTLRIGFVGAGESEGYNPGGTSASLINVALVSSVYDTLANIGPDLAVTPALATAWKANADSSEWTVTLRDGVTWHDGSPLTTADVIYSMKWTADSTLVAAVANIDLPKVTAPDARTVVIPLKSPDLLLPVDLGGFWIIKDGTKDFTRPVGTGPFVFGSLTPGQQAQSPRNPDYWDSGKPYVDTLVIRSISDDTARLNALLGGQIDILCQLPFAQGKAQEGSGMKLLDSTGVSMQAFYMAVDQKPFDDVRVRQAVRLLADRKQLVDVALSGYGQVANDLFGPGLQFYDSALPQRLQDVAKAKQLLGEAGYGSGLQLNLQTSPAAPGMVEAATLLAQQAKPAGVDIVISQVDAGAYFDPTRNYLTMPFAQTVWSGQISLKNFYNQAIGPGGAGNETHWTSAPTVAAVNTALAATDPAAATAAWAKVQQEQHDEGGYLWWASVNNLDATAPNVAGITASKYLNAGLPGSLANAFFTT